VTPLEPWEKVYIKLTSSQVSFVDIDNNHGFIGCINCHGGKEPAEFESAHDPENGFIRDPSTNPNRVCFPCHSGIVATNNNSMHTMAWGERTAIVVRELDAGNDHRQFDQCSKNLIEGFKKECAGCHTTCGQCHVSRPKSVQGGLINNHRFIRKPDQTNQCLACHGSRIGVDFRGELEGNKPDLHYLMAMKCWDCHQENFHADNSQFPSRYHIPNLPECTDCHSDAASDNPYHLMHWPKGGVSAELSCYVCHSQPYNNCNTCHTNGKWKEGYELIGADIYKGGDGYLEYPSFKIGYNYNPDLFAGEYIVVRHIPIAKDSYKPWGVPELANYNARPTWEYTSPHNIRKITAQTDTVGTQFCYENCHLVGNKSSLNTRLYLSKSFMDSLFPDEIIANTPVIVNDHLPTSWEKP